MVWISLGAMSISGHDLRAGTAENYRAFAAEAHGRSALYAELATAVADDPLVLTFLDKLPAAKRQPNPLFAAACYLLGEPADLAALRRLVDGRADELGRTMLGRRTQTNEPARCATHLPVLALLPEPLALIEVGASAGLTLLVDRVPAEAERAVDQDLAAGRGLSASRGPPGRGRLVTRIRDTFSSRPA